MSSKNDVKRNENFVKLSGQLPGTFAVYKSAQS